MPTYMVERIVPGATMDALTAMCAALSSACQESTAEGVAVAYLRSTLTPGDSRCRCLFEAVNADLVQAVNEAAQVPFSRIMLAVEFVPTRAPGTAPGTRSAAAGALKQGTAEQGRLGAGQ